MAPRTSPLFEESDARLTHAFFVDVLAMRSHRCTDGTVVMTYPPSELGIYPRLLSLPERAVLGPDGIGLTCDDLPAVIGELSAYGCLLVWVGTTARSTPAATFQVTLQQCVALVSS